MTRILVLALVLAGCKPYLMAESPAPPGRSARLDTVENFWGIQRYRAELSQGVALAISCSHGGPCKHVQIRSSDPAIAEVRPASVGVLQPVGYSGAATTAAFVVIGKTPGTARIHVATDDGDRNIDVTVISPPPAPNAATRAVTATK